jgi:hypothetical protein
MCSIWHHGSTTDGEEGKGEVVATGYSTVQDILVQHVPGTRTVPETAKNL